MKKCGILIGLMFILFAVFCIGSSSTKAAEVKTFGNYEYKVLDESKKTAALVHINNPGKIVNIPRNINGYTVVQVGGMKKVITNSNKANRFAMHLYWNKINEDSFKVFKSSKESNNVIKLIFPNSVVDIGLYAFCDCMSLKNIKFPLKLQNLSYCSFGGCVRLEKLDIPLNVRKISTGTFSYCRSLTKLNIHAKNLIIGEDSISTLRISGKSSTLSINIKSTTRNLKIMYDAITAHNFKQMIVDSHVKTLSIEQLGNPIKKLMIKGKLTKITGSKVMGTPQYKKTRKYLCASKVYAKKNSNAWKFCKKAYWPSMKGYSGENYEDDTYFTEDNIGIKPVKLVAYK